MQTSDPSRHGYVPASVAAKFSDGWYKRQVVPRGRPQEVMDPNSEVTKCTNSRFRPKTQMLYCQRCFRIQNYGSESATISPSHAPNRSIANSQVQRAIAIEKVVTQIPQNSIVIHTIDVLDVEASIVPEFFEAFAKRNIPVITVVNKMDCLPVAGSGWPEINCWLERVSPLLAKCRGLDGKSNVVPISSVNDRGFDNLETRLKQYFTGKSGKPVFVIGRENSGKSTFVTRFLRYIGYKHLGCVHYKRGVGGLTRSAIPMTTQDFIRLRVGRDVEIVDTPGIPSLGSISHHLTRSEDFRDVAPGQKLQPLSFSISDTKSLLVGALCRIEVETGSAIVSCFVSPKVTLHVSSKIRALDLLRRKAGTFLYPPHLSPDAGDVHPIASTEWVLHKVNVYCGPSWSRDDIVVSGLGWFSVYGNGHKTINVWVPKGVQVFRRESILPKFIRQFGSQPFSPRIRARGNLINRRKKLLVRSLRENRGKAEWREQSMKEFESLSRPLADPADTTGSFLSTEVESEYNIQ